MEFAFEAKKIKASLGFEPRISCLLDRRFNQLSHEAPIVKNVTTCCFSFQRFGWDFYYEVYLDMEKAMAPHSNTLAWKIRWMEEPSRLQSMGSLRVRHDWATSLSLFTFMHWRGNGNPLQCSCLENPRDGGAWWAAVYGVAQSRTRLKWLSSSSSSIFGQESLLGMETWSDQRFKIRIEQSKDLRGPFLFHEFIKKKDLVMDGGSSNSPSKDWKES